MALNPARPTSLCSRIIEIAGEPRNYPLVSIMSVSSASRMSICRALEKLNPPLVKKEGDIDRFRKAPPY
jgi:hypothetical protein